MSGARERIEFRFNTCYAPSFRRVPGVGRKCAASVREYTLCRIMFWQEIPIRFLAPRAKKLQFIAVVSQRHRVRPPPCLSYRIGGGGLLNAVYSANNVWCRSVVRVAVLAVRFVRSALRGRTGAANIPVIIAQRIHHKPSRIIVTA